MGKNGVFSIIIAALNEEEHVGKLVRSIFDQSYRPMEIIFVDDGSADDTLRIVRKLKAELSSKGFTIDIFETRRDYYCTGAWAAWNLGLIKAKGEYILFLPGDAQFIEVDTLNKIKENLVDNQVVSFYFKPIIDNQLEFNIALDFNPRKRPFYCAYQSDLIRKVTLDPHLGVGGDWDLSKRLEESGLIKNHAKIEAEIGIHWPHTYLEYSGQRFWRGRTVWPLLRKYPTTNVLFRRILFPISTIYLLFMSIASLFVDLRFSVFFMLIFFLVVLYFFLESPVKTLNRLLHLIFVRFLFGSFIWCLGLIYGFCQYFIKREFHHKKG